MPTVSICPNCSNPTDRQELCPHCFVPLTERPKRFTVEAEIGPSHLDPSVPTLSKAGPRFDKITFRPSSTLSRTFHRSKSGAISLVVSLIIAFTGAYFWRDRQLDQAQQHTLSAQKAFESEQYEESLSLWHRAFQSHRMAFHKKGQAVSLLQTAHCNSMLNRFDEALHLLDRAETLEASSQTRLARVEIHRRRGFYNLELAEDRLSADSNKDALRYAEIAIEEFKISETGDQDVAKAHRLAARALAEQFDFSPANQHLEAARELVGNSEANRLAAANILELNKLYQQAKLEKARRERYIPDKKLDLLAVANSIKSHRNDRYRYSRENTGYSSPRTYSSQKASPPYSFLPPKSVVTVRAHSDSKPDYPTYQPPRYGASHYESGYRHRKPVGQSSSVYRSFPTTSYSSYSASRPKANLKSDPGYPTAKRRQSYPTSSQPNYRYPSSNGYSAPKFPGSR